MAIIALAISSLKSDPLGQNVANLSPAQPVTQLSSAQESATGTSAKTIQYEVLKQWDIPGGGKGEVVVIPTSYLNDTDMTALGQKLKNDLINDRDSFVFVYSNKQAATLRDKVINDTATTAELKIYDPNFVATYTKNADTGFHKFQIMLGGVNGNNNKDITY